MPPSKPTTPDNNSAGLALTQSNPALVGIEAAAPLFFRIVDALRAESGRGAVLHWFVGDSLLGQSQPGETLNWTPPHAGHDTLRVVDADGRSETRELAKKRTP